MLWSCICEHLQAKPIAAIKSISLLIIAGTRSRVESVLPDTSEGIGLDLVDGCGVAKQFILCILSVFSVARLFALSSSST